MDPAKSGKRKQSEKKNKNKKNKKEKEMNGSTRPATITYEGNLKKLV